MLFFEAFHQTQQLHCTGSSSNARHSPATMKISSNSNLPPPPFPAGIAHNSLNPSPDSDLRPYRRTSRRKPRTPATRLRRSGASVGKRSRPETPLSKWKIHEDRERCGAGGDPIEELDSRPCRKREPKQPVAVSARKLAAGLWRLQLPEVAAGDPGRRVGSKLQVKLLRVFF